MAAVEAEYENGVLRPMKPIRLQPGERAHIIIKRQGGTTVLLNPRNLRTLDIDTSGTSLDRR